MYRCSITLVVLWLRLLSSGHVRPRHEHIRPHADRSNYVLSKNLSRSPALHGSGRPWLPPKSPFHHSRRKEREYAFPGGGPMGGDGECHCPRGPLGTAELECGPVHLWSGKHATVAVSVLGNRTSEKCQRIVSIIDWLQTKTSTKDREVNRTRVF